LYRPIPYCFRMTVGSIHEPAFGVAEIDFL
jgi:hypothetical protein